MPARLLLGIVCLTAALSAQILQGDGRHLLPSQDFETISAFPDWPVPSEPKPASAVVSLRELQHPVSKKALRAAYEAQLLSRANKIPQAIAKLEKAVHIDPSYRDAHWNLGVQYAHVGRLTDARVEFRKALDIGPPAAAIYVNLAFASAVAGQPVEAETFARKALELDPANRIAQVLLKPESH